MGLFSLNMMLNIINIMFLNIMLKLHLSRQWPCDRERVGSTPAWTLNDSFVHTFGIALLRLIKVVLSNDTFQRVYKPSALFEVSAPACCTLVASSEDSETPKRSTIGHFQVVLVCETD